LNFKHQLKHGVGWASTGWGGLEVGYPLGWNIVVTQAKHLSQPVMHAFISFSRVEFSRIFKGREGNEQSAHILDRPITAPSSIDNSRTSSVGPVASKQLEQAVALNLLNKPLLVLVVKG
jgi:hypothetical protein